MSAGGLSMIQWLHITDLHMKKDGDADQQNFCGALLKSCADREITADFVVATGDFHNFQDSGDYRASLDFLRELMAALQLDMKKDLFMVPGNHDVGGADHAENVRAFLSYAESRAAESAACPGSDYAAALTEQPNLLQALLGDFDSYRKMAGTLIPAYREGAAGCQDPAGVHVRTWRDQINILHLNTAILSDGQRGHMEAADINLACGEGIRALLNNGLPAIVLGHHSFHDLHPTVKARLVQLFNQANVWAYFAGDVHRPNYHADDYLIDRKTQDGTWPNIIAGRTSAAIGDSCSEPGAVLCRWDEHSTAALHYLRWEPEGSGAGLTGLAGNARRTFAMRGDMGSRLYYGLLDRLAEIRDDHPSFQLMKIDEGLFPGACLNLEDCRVSGGGDGRQEVLPLSQFFRKSWGQRAQNHLTLEGEGGIGKTVALLSLSTRKGFLPHHVPAVYIPLYALNTRDTDESIKKYLLEVTLRGDARQYDELCRLADTQWRDGPRLILLLDGFNETSPESRYQIIRDIEAWSSRRGVQLVITSRFDIRRFFPNLSGTLTALKLQPLDRRQIAGHLEQAHIPLPPSESPLWTVINYPLMLALYVQTQALQRRDSTVPLDWLEAKNAGTILWNYLQRELWRCQRQTRDRDMSINCVLATELIAPHLAWEMVRSGQFLVPEEEFSARIEAIRKHLETNRERWPKHVRQVIRRCGWNRSLPDADTLFHLLTRELNLFRIREGAAGPTVSLMHQRFRDCLAAIHLLNLAQALSEEGTLPNEWRQPIDYYVMDFAAELLRPGDATAEALWNANRRLRPPVQTAAINLLELYRRTRNFDFSELDFSHMDLRKVHLHSYRRPLETHLRLPTDGEKLCRTLLSPETFAPEGHVDVITQTVVTPDSLRFVTASYDGTLRVWDVNTCRTLRILEGHTSYVTDAVLTADGRKCVSASGDHTLRVWELDTGACKGTLRGHADCVMAAAMCTDGHTCASASKDGTVRLWNIDSGRQTKRIQVFNAKQIRCILKVRTAGSDCFAFVTKGGDVRIWDAAAHRLSPELEGGLYGDIHAEAMSPNGRWFAVSTDDGLQIWDTGSGERTGECPSVFTALAITADSSKIIGTCENGTFQIRSTASPRQCLQKVPLHKEALQITVVPDESRCMVTLDTGTKILSLHTGEVLKEFSPIPERAVITPDGRRYICGNCALEVWNLGTCTRMCGTEEGSVSISAAAITPDGGRCVSASSDGLVRLWDISRGQLIGFLETPVHHMMEALTVTADGSHCIGISKDGTMQTWEIRTGALTDTRVLEDLWFNSAAITPDGSRCVGSPLRRNSKPLESNQILLWDLTRRKGPRELPSQYFSYTAMALTTDGRCLISANNTLGEMGTVQKIDLRSGRETPLCWKPGGRKNLTNSQVNSIAATPDGSCMILGTCDHIAVWHKGDREARLIPSDEWIYAVAVTPDGRRCVSASHNTLRVWDIGTGECVSAIELLHNIDLLGVDLSQAECRPKSYAKTLYQNGALTAGGKPEDDRL